VLPDICTTVAQVEETGHAVLGTAEDNWSPGRNGWWTPVSRYFTDLEHGSIKVGVLHSLSGTMTASERPLQELLVMLIEQKNARGGLLGRPIEPIIMNPRSNPKLYAEQAHALIAEQKVGGDLRLLDLGLAQGGAADRRARAQPSCSIRASTKARKPRPTSSTPARPRTSRACRRSTSCASRAIAASS